MISTSISRILARNIRQGDCGGGITSPAKWVSLALSPLSSSFSTSAPSATSIPLSQEKEGRSIWAKMLLFIPGGIALGLGTWQVLRRQEKIKMLEYRQNRLEMEPLKFDQIAPASENLDSLDFRRVQCKGVFDEKMSIYVGPRSRSISGVTENGYYLISPLKPVHGNPESVQSPILVNRGWVPRSWRDESLEVPEDDRQPTSRPSSPTQDIAKGSRWRFWSKKPNIVEEAEHLPAITPVEVTGVVRGSEKPSIFVPPNDPGSSQWFYVDVPAIARACGLPENTVYIEDVNENVDPSNPYPIPKDSNALIRFSVMPQDHVNYIMTWYSLSAAVTFMAFRRLNPKRRRR